MVAAVDGRADGAHRRRRRALPEHDRRTARARPARPSPTTARRSARRSARSFKGTRVAWFKDLGGIPFEPEITRVVNANRQVFVDLGCVVEEAEPDFAGVDEAFPILRHLSYHSSYSTPGA